MKIKQKIISLLLFFLIFPLGFNSVKAETYSSTREESLDQIYTALDNEYELISDYNAYSVDIENDTTSTYYEIISQFRSKIIEWERILENSKSVYSTYSNSTHTDIANLSRHAKSHTEIAIEAIDYYRMYLNEDLENLGNVYLDNGDELFVQYINEYDQISDLYNEVSGVSGYMDFQTYLFWGWIISGIISIFLFLKAKNSSYIKAEKMRSEIYFDLTKSTFAMFLGLIITWGGLSLSLSGDGGSYYIFYGPVIFGGWAFLKGLYKYVAHDRSVLNDLSKEERVSLLRKSFGEEDDKKIEIKKEMIFVCKNCDAEQDKNNKFCDGCGEKLVIKSVEKNNKKEVRKEIDNACKSCGKEQGKMNKFCEYCGSKM